MFGREIFKIYGISQNPDTNGSKKFYMDKWK